MDKIICDICGTAYPETAEACPICGYPRQDNAKVIAEADENAVLLAPRGKVKGGRFSNKNVKKRAKAAQAAAMQREDDSAEPEEADNYNPNKPLLIVIAILLVAIALVSLYIGVRFFRSTGGTLGPAQTTTAATTTAPVETTTQPTELEIPCAAVSLDAGELTLAMEGREYRLKVRTLPENTTDVVQFASSEESVARVSGEGVITAVGPGQAVITVTCGEAQVQCVVNCAFGEPTEPSTEATVETTQATQPVSTGLVLSHSDVSLFTPGESFTISAEQDGRSISLSNVEWSSSNDAIATVKNGRVTAVAPGMVTITAAYNGEEASCIVRCQFTDSTWAASQQDVTLSLGESFELTVSNSSGQTADVTWSASAEGIVTISGSTITGTAAGTVTLTTEIDGVSLSCVVRVKD